MERVLVYGMTSNPGGIESYLLNLLKCAKKYGIQLDFVTDFSSIAYEEVIQKSDGEIYYISRKGRNLMAHWRDFFEVLTEHPEYKCVYFNALDAGVLFTVVVPWILRRKIVIHSHNGETDKKILHKLSRPFLNMITDKRVACSYLAAEFMFGKKAFGKKAALVVPNAIEIDKYKFRPQIREKLRKEMNLENQLVICHVGRLSEQKNPFRLLEIFKVLLEKEENAVLLSVGTGEIEKEVRAYAKSLGVEKKVLFLGKRDDVADLLQVVDVFLLPSRYEGLPIVAIEAQAAGIPLVLSDVISKEVNVSGEACFLNLQETNEKWAEAIIKYAKKKRYDCVKKLKEKGYDNCEVSKQTQQLIVMLKNDEYNRKSK